MAAININIEQFEQLIRGEKPVLVDFWKSWMPAKIHQQGF